MMTRKLTFVLATTVVMAALPQVAHACTGDACNFVSVSADGKSITNSDPQLKAEVYICLFAQGSCPPRARPFIIGPQATERVDTDVPIVAGSRATVTAVIISAKFIGTRPAAVLGPKLLDKVSVTNSGQIPLKVVIFDSGSVDIGHSPDYKTGSFDIKLSKGVAKYHWEAFAQGAAQPCQKQRDESKASITVHCQR